MPKRHNKKLRRAARVPRAFSNVLQDTVSRVPFRNIPFYLEQASSGTGMFTSANSQASLTASNSFPLDPFNLGARVNSVAADFLQYRFERLKVSYVSFTTASGVAPQPGGAGSPSYVERGFVVGLYADPALSTISFQSNVEFGGKVCRTSQSSTIANLSGGPLGVWKFTSTAAASPTTIDLRMVAPLKMYGSFADTSTTAAARYGCFIVEGILLFRGPANNAAPLGLAVADEAKVAAPQAQSAKSSGEPATQNNRGWF